jgi:methionine-S-sulfoxide reductase
MNAKIADSRTITIAAAATLAIVGAYVMSYTNHASAQPGAKAAANSDKPAEKPTANTAEDKPPEGLESVTFGSGCFWCTEAVFSELKGVTSAFSGYSGGTVENPTYEQVCTGRTGHAEVVQVTYDPKVIKFSDLLAVFWQTHDPTTLNAQGADHGTQYRSAIFYHTEEQKKEAEYYKKKLDESGAFRAPLVTEITKFEKFYPAEDYHQEYYAANPEQGYCRMVIAPKLEKFHKAFADKLKTE